MGTDCDSSVLFDVFPHLDEWCIDLVVEMAKAHDLYYGTDYNLERKGRTCIIHSRCGVARERYTSAVRNRRLTSREDRPVLLLFNDNIGNYRI